MIARTITPPPHTPAARTCAQSSSTDGQAGCWALAWPESPGIRASRTAATPAAIPYARRLSPAARRLHGIESSASSAVTPAIWP